eukprot:g729.t1
MSGVDSLAVRLRRASPELAVQSSVREDTQLLAAILARVRASVDTSLLGHTDGPAPQDVALAVYSFVPQQPDIDALIHFVFDCRYGWSERSSEQGRESGSLLNGVHSPARSGGAAARRRAKMSTASARSQKKTLNDTADALIDVFFEMPPSLMVLEAMRACLKVTGKPVVRQQLLVHFFSWIKHCLRNFTYVTNLHQLDHDGKKLVGQDHSSKGTAMVKASDTPEFAANAVPPAPALEGPPLPAPVNRTKNSAKEQIVMGDAEYACALDLIVLSLTDVWSAIRKASSAHLYSVADLFPINQVRKLFGMLCCICHENGIPASSERTNVAPSKKTASSDSVERAKSLWREKNGALMGITAIIKKFKRGDRYGARKRYSPIGTTLQNELYRGNRSPRQSTSPTSSIESASGAGKMSLDLSGLIMDNGLDTNPSPPASPAGRKQRFPNAHSGSGSHDGSTYNTSPLSSTSDSADHPRANMVPRATLDKSSSIRKPKATDSNMVGPKKSNHMSNSLPVKPGAKSLLMCAPATASKKCEVLFFGQDYECEGLPDFICSAIHGVTFELIGHEQLSVRENATRAFAAFLSRSPPAQTINAFADVISRLEQSVNNHVGSERSAHRAEGLLGLCVILAKLRLIPSDYMMSNWEIIFSTLEGYLGHQASTVRQMSSTVFKHLAFKPGRMGQEPFLLLVDILKRLVFGWSVNPVLHANLGIPSLNMSLDSKSPLPWQSLEGRMLVYELVIGHLLSNHRHHIAIEMAPSRANVSVEVVAKSSKQARRSSCTNAIRSVSSITNDQMRKAGISKRRRDMTPLDVMSPDPKPTASPALNVGGFQSEVATPGSKATSMSCSGTEAVPQSPREPKKTVSKDLTAAVFELMVQIHSLFRAEEEKDNSAVSTTNNNGIDPEDEKSRDNGALELLAPLRLNCSIEDARAHLDIIIQRVLGIHKTANDKSAVKKTSSGFVDAAGKKISSRALATVLRKQKRAADVNAALTVALAPHLPIVLENGITTVRQQLSLLPVVLAWSLLGDKVDQRVGMLDAVITVLQNPDVCTALLSSSNMSLLEGSIAPLCNVLGESPEAPVLGKVLDAVLALVVSIPKTEVSKVLGVILPVVASRLKRAAPQEMRDSFVTLGSDSEEEDGNQKKSAGVDWDDEDDDEDDDWDDWDEEGSAETGNDLISAELGSFVVSLEGTGTLGDEGLQGFDYIADADFEVLHWALMTFR